MRTRSRLLVGATMFALVTTGCASTNQRGNDDRIDALLVDEAPPADGASGTTAPPGGESDATGSTPAAGGDVDTAGSQDGSSSSGATSGATGGTGGGSTGSGPTGGGSTGGSPGATGSSGGGNTPQPSADDANIEMGTGVTADTITIGVQAGETGAAFAAVGAALQPAYEGDMAQVLADWLNANGGIRGRQVVIVHHETETTQGTFASQAQEACSTFTEDNQVFAVISSAVGGDDSMAACTNAKQTPLIERNTWIWDQPYFDENPNLYRPGHFRAEDGYRAYLEGLHDLGFYEGATVGLLRFDAPVFERMMDGVVEPTMTRLGVAFNEYVVGSPAGVGDFGGAGAEMGAAVLRMRSDGVTHVIMVENAGIMPFFFLKEAESQGYRPTYGFSTIDIPDTQASQGDQAQLTGSVAIGWAPSIDAGDGSMPDYETPEYLLCRKVLTDGGVQNVAGFYAQSMCDSFWMLKAALEQAPSLTADGLRAGVAELGSSYRSSFTIKATYSANKRWGSSTVRALRYVDDCSCYQYFGREKRVV